MHEMEGRRSKRARESPSERPGRPERGGRRRQPRERKQRTTSRELRRGGLTDPDFVFFHLAKNGGGAIRDFLRPLDGRWVHAMHRETLPGLVERFPGTPIFFFARHPVTRFVSGFNNFRRAREHGKPKLPNDAHLIAHNWFATPDELACALVTGDERRRSAAEYVMATLPFVKNPMVNNLVSVDVVDEHLDRIAFIGLQEDFVRSVEALRVALDLPAHLALPSDDRTAHRAPDSLPKEISSEGQAALLDWFHDDLVLYEHCSKIHQRHMDQYAR